MCICTTHTHRETLAHTHTRGGKKLQERDLQGQYPLLFVHMFAASGWHLELSDSKSDVHWKKKVNAYESLSIAV